MNGSAIVTESPFLPVSVSITPSANPVPAGSFVTFTAIPANGGASPSYQWSVNAVDIAGATDATYGYHPANPDQIKCVMTSNFECTSGNPATSNKITMIIIPEILTVTGTITDLQTECYSAIHTITVAGTPDTFIVEDGGSATLIAGQNILYEPGTKIEQGGYMLGQIAPGGPWCGLKASSIVTTPASIAEATINSEQSFFKVYPNPTAGAFTLEFTQENAIGTVKVEVYGMQGEKVLTTSVSGERKYSFSLSGKPVGFYFLRVISDDKAGAVKIIKQ